MPFAEITIIEGRSVEKKTALIEKVTDAIVEALDAPKETVRICIREVPADNWGIGGKPYGQVR
ncbi:2-hydroxymuconate tautomerase [Magnetospira sp. QH-2]|uniref:2-hydroxymuconate tautomerase n=1 Tax=Magnetospira sp. (strain QH-2) TaxID=1288970 RepID=UPI0003E81A1D|nr:2-hydroxymuconate tautomerase [Magnetospira sp. QH-2]CCQ72616.1 4-oxalocrotonate tautomerase [Magnetospira sp. QH-2]